MNYSFRGYTTERLLRNYLQLKRFMQRHNERFEVYNGKGDCSCGSNHNPVDKELNGLSEELKRRGFTAYTMDDDNE